MAQQEDYVIEDSDDDSFDEKSSSHSDKEIETEPDNLLDKIDFNVPQIVVCVGKPKRGKSNAVKWFVLKNSVDNFYRQKNRQSQFVADSMIHSVNLIAVDKILMNASTLTQHSFSENALTNDRTFNAAYFATAPDHAET